MLQNKTTGCMPVSSSWKFSSLLGPSPPTLEQKLQNSRRAWESGAIVTAIFITCGLFYEKTNWFISETLNVVTMITPIITYLFLPLLSPFKDFCLKTRSIFSYTYDMCSYPCFFLLSKRDCFHLFLLLPATLKQHAFIF